VASNSTLYNREYAKKRRKSLEKKAFARAAPCGPSRELSQHALFVWHMTDMEAHEAQGGGMKKAPPARKPDEPETHILFKKHLYELRLGWTQEVKFHALRGWKWISRSIRTKSH